MKRNAPIIQLVPDKYRDLNAYHEALQDVIQEQGVAVADLATTASLADVITSFNALLASLRAEGTISS